MTIFTEKRILIFDECIFMGRLLGSIIGAFNVGQLTICNTWKDAEYHIKEIKYDCIFCDWSKWPDPELECLKFVRYSGSANDPSTPVIIATGFTSLPQIIAARDIGATEIISKPIAPSHVFDKLYNSLYNTREFLALVPFLSLAFTFSTVSSTY
tara:strand:- start:63 stop:524 length:462 start_codon:yes stop_codon:yes gene_type:complete